MTKVTASSTAPDEAYASTVRRVADDLRHLADEVERLATPDSDLRTLQPDFHGSAEDVLHKIVWGFANLNLPRVVRHATRAANAGREAPK